MVVEPVLREPGSIGFAWLEIQRAKPSLQTDVQSNMTGASNDTLGDFGFYPRQAECEHKCPELEACIDSNLWCDGRINCPSGFDESELECGAARRLLELSSGLYAALGCVAAACAACLIFCCFGLLKKRKKALPPPTVGHNNYHAANSLYGSSAYFGSTNHSNTSSNYNSINRTLSKSHAGSRSTLNGGTLKKKDQKKLNGNGNNHNHHHHQQQPNNNNTNNNGDLYIDPDS